VLPMVRVDRLYLGPMSAPDQLGSDKFSLSLKLGSELLPETAVFAWLSGPVRARLRLVKLLPWERSFFCLS
jgi:hypothetical protein